MSETVEILSSDDEGCSTQEPKQPKRKIDEIEKEETVLEDDENISKRPKLNGETSPLKDEKKENLEQTNEKIEEKSDQNKPPQNHLDEISTLFESSEEVIELLQLCYNKFTATKLQTMYMDKIKLLKPHFDKINDCIQSEEFKNNTREKIDFCKKATMAQALQKFVDLFKEIEITSKRVVTSSSAFVDKAVKKLENFLEQLHKKIDDLENAEVDFDDEEDSTYIQLQRYRERAFKVYRKLCKYYKENEYSGDLTRSKIDFCSSEHSEINKAINKVFKDGTKFPNYSQMEEIIRKCVDDKKLGISEYDIKKEAEFCFRKLGNLLQRRRQLELFNMHTSYLTSHDEPKENAELLKKLNENKNNASQKISKICEEFVRLQEEGKEIQISDDSDDSEYEYSDEDEPKNDTDKN